MGLLLDWFICLLVRWLIGWLPGWFVDVEGAFAE